MGVEAKDLRIGNYVKAPNGKEIEIVTVIEQLWVCCEYCEGHAELFEPITLTEEWLLRLGFTNDNQNKSLYVHPLPINPELQHKDLGFSYPSFFFNNRLCRWMDAHTRVCVDNVHQLQNLYYAITGEELKLKTD
jgi:hypothetical protein